MRNLDHMPSCSTVPAGVQLSAAAFLAFFPNTDGEAPNLGSSNSEKMQEPVTPTPFYWLMYLQRRPCPLSQEGLIQLAFPQHSSGTPQTGSYPDKKKSISLLLTGGTYGCPLTSTCSFISKPTLASWLL